LTATTTGTTAQTFHREGFLPSFLFSKIMRASFKAIIAGIGILVAFGLFYWNVLIAGAAPP